MNKYLCFFVLVTIARCTFSQSTFFNVYRTSKLERAFETIQTSNGNYILVGKRSTDVYENDVKGLVMLIDDEGHMIEEFTIDNENKSYFFTIDKSSGQDNRYLISGSQDSILGNSWRSSLLIYEIDENIEVQSNHCFHHMNNHLIKPWKTSIVNDSTILLLIGSFDMSYTIPPLQSIITEVRLPADSVRSYISNIEITCIPQDILFIPQNNEAHVFYFGGYLTDASDIKILRLDSMLNSIVTVDSPSAMFSTACATPVSDSTYLLTATAYPVSGITSTRAVSTFKMDKYGNGIYGMEFYNHPDTILYGGFGTNTAIVNDTIFITGIYNIDPFGVPWQNTPTWIQITRLDMELNILSHYFYGGDAMYIPYCIIPTLDDGVFVTGYMWDYNIPNNQQHDIFALKLNSDGLIVNIPEEATWQAGEAIVFPNPADDIVNVEFSMLYSTAIFSLTDITGKTALEKQLTANRQSVNISAIPAGTYVFRIFNKNGLDERGKLVVE